ncbi:hypothetical protein [Paenibacillus tyrfis]|uniref:hypothetical protein n=1 Tax=Paenibacillus tyrfis TaxID=1501230 RepID=UPI0020A0F13C|nr:hypothetical protein [Paenibacillus tyrfis]MCP1309000.1 hypothetical protein [Paenibacillus tyrfis]
MKTIKMSELRPGQNINYNGEIITKEQAEKIIASGERPVLHTVSDGYIQAALNDLSRARKADKEPKDYCAPDPLAKHILY